MLDCPVSCHGKGSARVVRNDRGEVLKNIRDDHSGPEERLKVHAVRDNMRHDVVQYYRRNTRVVRCRAKRRAMVAES